MSVTMVRPTARVATLVGRSLAMCVHPYAAWRTHSLRGRAFVVSAYVAASYVLTLGVMELANF